MARSATVRGVLAAAMLSCAGAPAPAQTDDPFTTKDEVRREISEAMEAIGEYSAQERDKAVAKAREALGRLDAEIARREQALREDWSTMSAEARETARASLRDLRAARNRLSERFGALESGAASAWEELKAGFANAWQAFLDAWNDAREDMTET